MLVGLITQRPQVRILPPLPDFTQDFKGIRVSHHTKKGDPNGAPFIFCKFGDKLELWK